MIKAKTFAILRREGYVLKTKEEIKFQIMRREKIKNNAGITLIALVATIVILLILAGITINIVLGEGGLINRSKLANVAARAGQVEDEIALWKSDMQLKEIIGGTPETEPSMLQRLTSKGIITSDDEIDRVNKIIKIKSNGSVFKEISYGKKLGVEINITQTQEILSTTLQVTSIEGLTEMNEEDIRAMVQQMDRSTKIEKYKEIMLYWYNEEEDYNFETFSELFDWIKGQSPEMAEMTEESVFAEISDEDLNEEVLYNYYNYETDSFRTYKIFNPDNKESSTYIATEDGTYTFTVKDLITNTTYTKEIQVSIITTYNNEDMFIYTAEGYITGIKENFIDYTDDYTDYSWNYYLSSNANYCLNDKNLRRRVGTSITIPAQIGETTIIGIADGAFQKILNLENVQIETGLTDIEYEAFAQCPNLTSVSIPSSVTSIDSCAFEEDYNLANITVAEGNSVYDSRNNCNAIIETATNTLIIGCKNTSIPNSATSIGNNAFKGSGLTSLEIPNSVTSIGSNAFSQCTGLTNIEIPNSVTSIGWNAFSQCTGLTNIEIPNFVTTIEWGAFSQCTSLTNIEIPNSVKSIERGAFEGCTNLTSVSISSSVTSIDSCAFEEDYNLANITVAEGNSVYDSRNNCNAIIETGTNTLITGCKNTIIPNSVTSIGNHAFYRCTGLTSIEIPNTVTSIGESAFSNCTSLTNIEIPNTVTSIGGSAFSNCTSLTNIELPNSVNSIEWGAFYNCISLTNIEIPSSIAIISGYSFLGCGNLTNITIHKPTDSISGAPWGAYNATVNWVGE